MKRLVASSLAPLSLLALSFPLGFQGCSTEPPQLIDGGIDSGVLSDGGSDGGPDSGNVEDAGADAGDGGPNTGPDAGDLNPHFGIPSVTPVAPSVGQLATGDFNGDGKLDLVVSLSAPDSPYEQTIKFSGTGVEVLIGEGNGYFQAPIFLATGSSPRGVVVLDINRDGLPDVAVGVCGTSNRVSYFLNGGADAGFGPRQDVNVSTCPYSLAVVAGLSGGGHAGLATAGPGPFSVGSGAGEVDLLVAADGGLQVSTTLSTPDVATAVASADLNGDGLPDLAVTTSRGSGGVSALVSWLAVNGGGWHSLAGVSLDHGPYHSIAAGDIDANGTIDLAMVSFYQSRLALLLGHGDGSFGVPTYQGVAGNAPSVALGKFGRSGPLDVAVATHTSPFVGLSFFPGGGQAPNPLGAEQRLLTDGLGGGIAVGDFNGDGLLDIAVSIGDRDAVAVVPGLFQPPFLPNPATYRTAAHIPTPAVAYNGGAVLHTPEIVTVTYQNDPNTQVYQQFDEWIAGSQWLATIGADYGVSNGTAVHVVLHENAPASLTDSDIQTLLYNLIVDGGVPPPVVADGGTIAQRVYFMYFPYATTISGQGLGTSCQSFGAYHSEDDLYSTPFAYAVIPTCDPYSPYYAEVSASHELAEAASDPLPMNAPAYSNRSYNNGWVGEIGDLCTPFNMGYQLNGGTFYAVQRIWSNSAADAGLQPCVPAGDVPYAGVSPVAGDSLQLICDSTNPQPCASVYYVSAGQTFDVALTSWVSAPSVAPAFAAVPYFVAGLVPATFAPDVTQDSYNLHNGEVGHLSVTIPAGTASHSLGIFTVLSGLDNDNYAYWPIMVYVQ